MDTKPEPKSEPISEPIVEEKQEESATSMVYSREEYAKKEFWNDRFKESKGFFDWYANWKEIRPAFEEMIGDVLGYEEGQTK